MLKQGWSIKNNIFPLGKNNKAVIIDERQGEAPSAAHLPSLDAVHPVTRKIYAKYMRLEATSSCHLK